MDLALNNLQRLICHKTQTTNQQPKAINKANNMTTIDKVKNKMKEMLVKKLPYILM